MGIVVGIAQGALQFVRNLTRIPSPRDATNGGAKLFWAIRRNGPNKLLTSTENHNIVIWADTCPVRWSGFTKCATEIAPSWNGWVTCERLNRAYGKRLFLLLALEREGSQLRRPLSDYLDQGIRELRARIGRVHYRVLYSFIGSQVAIISHGITKEGEVADSEISLAANRVGKAKSDPAKHTVIFQRDKL